MQRFQFYQARSIEDALDLLSEKGERTKIIAGGTDLIPALRSEDVRPEWVLDILEIEPLRGVQEMNDRVWIGPTTTFTEIEESPILKERFPLLVQAASSVGGPQIRNRGTIGGNIVNASPAADVLPALVALGAELEVRSKRVGTRHLPIEGAIEAPYRCAIRGDELLTGIVIKKYPPETKSLFKKLGRRNAMARARMNLSLLIRLNGEGLVEELRIVPGAVMPVAKRIEKAEKTVLGRKPIPSFLEEASKTMEEEILRTTGMRWSSAYKLPVIKALFMRSLTELLG